MYKKLKSERGKAYPAGVQNDYGIDHLTIGETPHVSNDSELLLSKQRKYQTENKINTNKSLTHECNVPSNLLNPM